MCYAVMRRTLQGTKCPVLAWACGRTGARVVSLLASLLSNTAIGARHFLAAVSFAMSELDTICCCGDCNIRHIDSAYVYRNEVEVGQAVIQFKREDIFVSKCLFRRM